MIKKLLLLLTLFTTILFLFGCVLNNPDNYEISEYIRQNCNIHSVEESAKTFATEYKEEDLENYGLTTNDFVQLNEINENEEYYTRYIKYQTTGGIDELNNYGQYDRQLYPGALVDISSPSIGDIHLEPSSRNLSISLETTTSESSYRPYVVKKPSLSETRVGVNKLVNMTKDKIASIPTKLSMKVESVKNSDELRIALGITVKSSIANLSDKFNYETTNSSNAVVLVLTQVYYTIDVDSKTTPSQYFSSDLSSEEIKNGLKGTIPAMVSSVSYGRIAVVKLTSNDSLSSIENSLKADTSIKGISGKLSSEIQSKINSNRIHSEVLIYGGSVENGSNIGTNMSFEDMIAEFSKQYAPDIASAVPISYRLNYIADGKNAKIMMTNEPTYIKVCCPKYSVLNLKVKKMEILDKNRNAVDTTLFFKADDTIENIKFGAIYTSKSANGDVLDIKKTNNNSTTETFFYPYSINSVKGNKNTINFTNYSFNIFGIDNSKIIKNEYQSLSIHLKLDICTTRSTWLNEFVRTIFVGGEGINHHDKTASIDISAEINDFNVFTSIDGFYADFSTSENGGLFRVYFECQLN